MICRDFERGVSPKSLSVMYQTCMDGVFECLRLRMRELEAVMRKPACACGLALAALIGIDAHVAIVADSGATVERVFRGRRGAGRRRGLEDSLVLTQYRQFALIGGC